MMDTSILTSSKNEDVFEDVSDGSSSENSPENEQEANHHSIIQVIKEELSADVQLKQGVAADESSGISKSDSFSSVKTKDLLGGSCDNLLEEDPAVMDDYLHDGEWLKQKRHIFILSAAGKPIYSMHGNEDKLATLFGVMQALVSFIQSDQDTISSIHAAGIKFVFLVKNTLILVAICRDNMSVHQLQMQLTDVYNQILSILTLSHMSRIFEKRKNFDLRRMLAGSERLIDHLLVNDSNKRKISNNVFVFLTNSVRIMPLSSATRNSIDSAIQSNCSKIKNLVFAVLIAKNRLISLVRMKKYLIHPADLRLIFNLIECSESFKTAESWTPICLPKFDMNGFLHAHVSYLAEDCQACLLLLSVDRDVFFTLSDAKKKITEKLRRTHCLEAINDEMQTEINLHTLGIPEIRHFIYKSKMHSQLLCSEISAPYLTKEDFERLQAIYCNMHQRIHNSPRPLKLIYEVKEREVTLAWITAAYELYAVFEPFVDKSAVIKLVDKLIKWVSKEEDIRFIKKHPTF